MNETKGFIKNPKLLEEDYKVNDLLDFSESVLSFSNRLATIEKSSTIGLIGKFGTGKSTMLYQIQKEREDKELWINFDAWKYPDRKDLWEGFVLDFADQLGKQKEIKKKIDGKSTSSDALDVIGNISDKLSLVPGLSAVITLLNSFLNTSPAKRVFEVQHILSTLISKQGRDIYVVVEDIDRSGDAGLFFLETMKQFISNLEVKNKIIVIIPISDDNYYKNTDSYLKTLDYVEFFTPAFLGLEKFVGAVFDNSLFEGEHRNLRNSQISWTGDARKWQIISYLEKLFESYHYVTIRVIKLILRKANQNYIMQTNDGHQPDFRVTICIESAKYIKKNVTDKLTYFDEFKNEGTVRRDGFFAAFIFSMITNSNGITEVDQNNRKELISSPYPIKFIKRADKASFDDHPSYPWKYGLTSTETGFGICDFYLNY